MDVATINVATSNEDVAAVKAIFIEYLEFIEAFLDHSLDFQGTEVEFSHFPDSYVSLFLAKIGDNPVAACGIKSFKEDICELKRLYCKVEGRGHKLGERLTLASLEQARKLGYTEIYLDTDFGLTHANRIYEKLGFKDIPRYYENPMGCSRYMALKL